LLAQFVTFVPRQRWVPGNVTIHKFILDLVRIVGFGGVA
jgi:hypothetical protein